MKLENATNYDEFISSCREMIINSPHVDLSFSEDKLKNIAHYFENAQAVDWLWVTRGGNEIDTFYDFMFSSALNGGYFHSVNNEIKQWEKNGSGSVALFDWIKDELWSKDMLPSIGENYSKGMISKSISEDRASYPQWRIDVCEEFSNPGKNIQNLNILFEAQNADWTYTFDLELVDKLVEAYPISFGGDPFRKKAISVMLMMTGWLLNRGKIVYFMLPLPTDYQMPRIFNYLGLITISEQFTNTLQNQTVLLEEDSPEVMHVRAAAIVAANQIGEHFQVSDNIVDNILFSALRKDEEFKKNSLPPMKCNTTWF